MKLYHFTNDLYGNYSHHTSDLTEAIEKLIEELSENRTFFVRLLFNNETCLLVMLQNDPVLFKIEEYEDAK